MFLTTQFVFQAHNSTLEDIQYEGANNAIYTIVSTLNDNLLTTIPTCTEHFYKPIIQIKDDDINPQTLVNALQVSSMTRNLLLFNLETHIIQKDLYKAA